MADPELIVVGHCTSNSARIFIVGKLPPRGSGLRAEIAYQVGNPPPRTTIINLAPADPYLMGVFNLSGLPDAGALRYAVDVVESGDNPDAASLLEKSGGNTLRLLPTDRPLRIALISCNGPEKVPHPRKYKLWRKLYDLVCKGEVDLAVHAGDQIYADDIWDIRVKEGKEQSLNPSDQASIRQLESEYRQEYVTSWRKAEVQAVLRSCPSVMMWDDHDIVDGWGSHDVDGEQPRQALFLAARTAFQEFQVSHGPPPIDAPNSFASAFHHNGVGILLLDARSHRNYRRKGNGVIVGQKQWESADKWLKSVEGVGLKRLFVVVGVPPIHVKAAVAEVVTGAMKHHALDDIRDGWTSAKNVGEARRLMVRLFNFMLDSPGTEVTVLSGDVHVGTLAAIESKYLLHRDGKIPNPIYQVSASGIGRLPPAGPEMALMSLAKGSIDLSLSQSIFGRLIELDGVGGFFLGQRNFAVLKLEPEVGGSWNMYGNLTVDYHADDDGTYVQKLHRMAPV